MKNSASEIKKLSSEELLTRTQGLVAEERRVTVWRAEIDASRVDLDLVTRALKAFVWMHISLDPARFKFPRLEAFLDCWRSTRNDVRILPSSS